MRFTHIDVNFDITYDGDQKLSKCAKKVFLNNFGDLHIWHQNWRHYVWTSLCEFIFLWTSSIVCVLDFLTFDIFLTFWHLIDILTSFNLNHLSPSQGYFLFLQVQAYKYCLLTSIIASISLPWDPLYSLSIIVFNDRSLPYAPPCMWISQNAQPSLNVTVGFS